MVGFSSLRPGGRRGATCRAFFDDMSPLEVISFSHGPAGRCQAPTKPSRTLRVTTRKSSGLSELTAAGAEAFLFGHRAPVHELQEAEEEEEPCGLVTTSRPLGRPTGSLDFPDFELRSALAMLLPSAVALHSGLATGGVAVACIPMAVPFSVPQVSPDTWLANKRARAFHRAVVACVYVQGAAAVLKFVKGDLIGGTYDALHTLMGVYATQPDGQRFFPTYVAVSAFNGLLGSVALLQSFQGVPLHFLPVFALVPPGTSLFAAYCGWQFCKEVNAIAAGLTGEGPQDTCFVHLFGAEWWPSALSPSYGGMASSPEASAAAPPRAPRFEPFAGDGRRLVEAAPAAPPVAAQG